MTIEEKMRAIYELEQKASISWEYGKGYTASIGEIKENFETFTDAVEWLYTVEWLDRIGLPLNWKTENF